MDTIVRTDAEISKSQSDNKNIFDYNGKSKSVEDYMSLAKEIIDGGF
jgi:nitrogenase subunit NifH